MSSAKRIAILVFLMMLSAITSSTGAIIYSYGNEDHIAIEGEIVEGDLVKLRATYERVPQHKRVRLIIDLDSPGGNLNEAMSIGRWIRQTKLLTGVSSHSSCASACVHIFAAGISKYPLGPLLIHRPYLVSSPVGGADAALKYALSASRSYFAEMNVPEALADVMFSIAPDRAKRLARSELEKYQLVGNDMAEDEERILSTIKKLGITRLEYMRRLGLYQRSPELAHCFNLQGDAQLDCARKASRQYGIYAGD